MPTKLFYGFGSVAFGVKDNGFSYFLLIFYNQVMGLPAQTVGLAIMIPIVGQASDNFRSKWGRRHPFMYAAAIPVAVSYLLLWNPPKALDHQGLFFYLIGTAILIRSFITCYEIPSSALAAELTTGYDERTKLLSYRFLFGWIGGLAMYFAALKIFLTPDATHKVGQLNVEGYAHYGMAAALLMLFAILVSAVGTHGQIPFLREAPHRKLNLPTLARKPRQIGNPAEGERMTVHSEAGIEQRGDILHPHRAKSDPPGRCLHFDQWLEPVRTARAIAHQFDIDTAGCCPDAQHRRNLIRTKRTGTRVVGYKRFYCHAPGFPAAASSSTASRCASTRPSKAS